MCSASKETALSMPTSKLFVPLKDRTSNQEAMVLAFVAEKSLSFSMVGDIIKLSKALAQDKKALNALSMDRTSASIKTNYGVGKTFEDRLFKILQNTAFSLNMDEATSDSLQKVVTVLVSFFSKDMNEVVVEHLCSFKVTKTDSQTLYAHLIDFFKVNNIPWANCISLLMDSCNVMRGSKTGLEKRLTSSVTPHLLDIDGDSCHHAHNAAKQFMKPFDYHVEGLCRDLHHDAKYSSDIKEKMALIGTLIGISFTAPQLYCSTRWLSIYDVVVDTIRMFDLYLVTYFTFMKQLDREHHLPLLFGIYKRRNVSAESKAMIREVCDDLRKKIMTPEGKDRKKRITTKLFDEKRKTSLILHFVASVLPLLKDYILLFQMNHSSTDSMMSNVGF